MLTLQEIFDKSAVHLLTQGERSTSEAAVEGGGNGCAYRGENGRMCAVGVLIPDDKYDPAIEGDGVYGISEVIEKCGIIENRHRTLDTEDGKRLDLMSELQKIHDGTDPVMWFGSLKDLAIQRGLSTAAIESFHPAKTARAT